MNVKAFFTAALGSALEIGVGTADDVLRHVSPDVLAAHLPRPLWARLLTACLGAPKVDAQLVIETVGIANLCEHVPAPAMWSCIADIAARALGKPGEQPAVPTPVAESKSAPAAKSGARVPLAPAPPAEAPRRPTPPPSPAAQGPAIPPVDHAGEERPAPSQRFRQASTGIGRIGSNQVRRPQAQAAPAAAAAPAPAPAPAAAPARTPGRRGQTELESETETSVETGDWRGREIAVDDSQLVDWSSDNTESRDEDFGDFSRKR